MMKKVINSASLESSFVGVYFGKTEIKGIDLCRPCKPLQENLGQDNII